MAADPALEAFLALSDDAALAYARVRAEALGLTLPPVVRDGVVDNLILLRRQAEIFIAALPLDAPEAIAAFEP